MLRTAWETTDFAVTAEVIRTKLPHRLMNAAGTCKGIDGREGMRRLALSQTVIVMLGSVSAARRDGNSGNVFHVDDDRDFSINSLGLPNLGVDAYIEQLPEMLEICHAAGKPLGASVAGFTPHEFGNMAHRLSGAGVDLIEVNTGCPNVWQGGKQKHIASFDPRLCDEIIYRCKPVKIVVKLSPMADPFLLEELAAVCNGHEHVLGVTSSNTFPNAFAFRDDGLPAIDFSGAGGDYGGLGGGAMKPIGLGQVRKLRQMLRPDILLFGVGGVRCGQDMLDYLKAGADVVQIATALLREGPGVFSRILAEYVELDETANPL
jgi:dihydroorotate dehydrogenase (fumarate)